MTHQCFTDGCTAQTVEGTGFCDFHGRLERIRAIAEMEADYDGTEDCAEEGTSEVQLEAVGQLNAFGAAA